MTLWTQTELKTTPASDPAPGSAKVIVYAGRHYGQAHYVIGRHTNGREMIVWHVADAPGQAFRVHACDTEALSPNEKGQL